MTSKRFRTLAPYLAIFAVEAIFIVGFLVNNPSFLREEWLFLDRTRTLGAWYAADDTTVQFRPFVRLVYALAYWPATTHSAVFLIPPILTAATACFFFKLLKGLLGSALAFGGALLWLVFPTHLTADHWVAAANIDLGAITALIALILLRTTSRPFVGSLISGLLMGVSVLLYEGFAPVLLLAPIVFSLIWHRSTLKTRALGAWIGIFPFVVFAFFASVGPRQKVFASPITSFYFNFGLVQPLFWVALPIMFASAIAVLVVFVIAIRTRRVPLPQALVLSGFGVWLVGYLPFSLSNYDAMFWGIGDRGNIVSGFGVVLFYLGVFMILKKDLGRISVVAAGILVVLCGYVHVDRSIAWAQTTRAVQQVGDCLIATNENQPIILQRGSGALASDVISGDATTEMYLYLINAENGPKAGVEVAPIGANPPGLDTERLIAESEQTLERLGCA